MPSCLLARRRRLLDAERVDFRHLFAQGVVHKPMARPGVQVRFSAASFAGLQTHRSGLPAKHSAVTSTLNFDPQPSDSSTTLWERG